MGRRTRTQTRPAASSRRPMTDTTAAVPSGVWVASVPTMVALADGAWRARSARRTGAQRARSRVEPGGRGRPGTKAGTTEAGSATTRAPGAAGDGLEAPGTSAPAPSAPTAPVAPPTTRTV